jgi:alpha-L-glutamate ligase-like protein
MFAVVKNLRRRGVLGINRRNACYVMAYNRRQLYPLVDNKVRTKQLAIKHGLPVPELYGVISTQHDAAHLPVLLEDKESFVIKPASGSGGEGILVINSRRDDRFGAIGGDWYSEAELNHHISNVITGMYSLGGLPDQAMLEAMVRIDPCFAEVAYQGVPDIRIIVFMGIPVMAMLRLPTRMSQGKANLHQGAIGVGIHLPTGKTVNGVFGNHIVSEHPDTGAEIAGMDIPNWQRMLEISATAYEMTGLGYLGVDLVLDEIRGPLMLELNARPGLNIQIANQGGLGARLKAVEQIDRVTLGGYSIEEKIALGCDIAA